MSNDDRSVEPPWTILKILQWTAGYFKQRGIESPRPAAEILLAHTLKCNRIDLYLNHDQPLHSRELTDFKQLIQRRIQREPVAYITGIKEFWSLDFKVTPDVLIPRPETEGLVEAALGHLSGDKIRMLELGCGSGAISVALAHERPNWSCLALDLSEKAIGIARLNAHMHLPEDRIGFMVGRWFDAIGYQKVGYELIVSNPPYIPSDRLPVLEAEIHQYEPLVALDGGRDGLAGIKHIVKNAPPYLKPGGLLLLEIGHDQGAEVAALGRETGAYDHICVEKDFAGHDRIARLERTHRMLNID